MKINEVKEQLLLDQNKKLNRSFYLGNDVVETAKKLLGKILVTNFDGFLTAVRITETEAYKDTTDKASHAYGGKRSKRTEIMYSDGGVAYVYLCYGVHSLFNIVTNLKEIPDAVLIRAGEPVFGIEKMLQRTGKEKPHYSLTTGPGNLSKALGIHYKQSGLELTGDTVFVVNGNSPLDCNSIIETTRIGVKYAQEDALRRYRFYIKGNQFVSKK